MCIENGISLACIPFWWDGHADSLSSTLHQILPHVFPNTSSPPIPSIPPSNFGEKKSKNFTINSHIMQGLDRHNEDPTGWYMSEKLDGIRAYWDGTQFWSKRGNIIHVPESSFKEGLPSFHIEGELWAGYVVDNERMNSIIKTICGPNKRNISLDVINKFKFCIFDAPQQEGNYQKRFTFLENYFLQNYKSNVSLIPIQICSGLTHLQTHLQEIINKGGEGIMLYHPDTPYENGHTRNLLKVKNYLESDVKFVKLNPKSYFFDCEQQNGQTCLVKCSGSDYQNPPPIGTVITAHHLGLFSKSKKLKQPTVIRLRYDLVWDELLLKNIE
jgi:DNA ligase-1